MKVVQSLTPTIKTMNCPLCKSEMVFIDDYKTKIFQGTYDTPPEYKVVWEEYYCKECDEYFTEWIESKN